MKAELAEGVELLRPYYPKDKKQQLLDRVLCWRSWFYQHGRWPTEQEVIQAPIIAAEEKVEADAA